MYGFVVQTSEFGPTQENGRFGRIPTMVCAMPSLEQSYSAAHPDKIDSSSVMTLKTLP